MVARYCLMVLLASVSGLSLVPAANACGDKFLVRLERDARGRDLPRAMTQHRASILVYRPARTSSGNEEHDAMALARVGHDVQMCDSAQRCTEALNSGTYQIVVADYRDLEALDVHPDPSRTRLIPVVSGVSRGEYERVKKRYGVAFDSAAPAGRLLAMVDRLIAAR